MSTIIAFQGSGMMKKLSSAPLFWPVIFWSAGLLLGIRLNVPDLFVYFSAFILIVLACTKFRPLAVLLLILLTGFLRMEFQEIYLQTPLQKIMQSNSRIQQKITGKIQSEITSRDGRYSFILNLHSINDLPLQGKVKLSTTRSDLRYGDVVETIAVLHQIRPGSNPSVFDAEKYFYRRNIQATGYSRDNPRRLSSEANPIKKFILSLRSSIKQRIEQRFPQYSGLIKAIVIGDKTDLDEMRQILGRAGLSHLLAVSGLHVGLISMVIFSLLTTIFKRNFARFILILLLVIYGFICNWPASVFRAVIMISLFLFAKNIQRKVDTNNILFCSFFVITAIHPYQINSAGLQMSFLAVFVLLNLIPQIKILKLEKHDIAALNLLKKIINYAAILICSSLFLNIFLAPVTIFHFQQFGFNGIIGNLLGIPLMSLILSLALLIIALPPLSAVISLYHSAFLFVMFCFNKWVNFAAALPWHFDFVSTSQSQTLLLFALLFSAVYFLQNLKRKIVVIPASVFVVLLVTLIFSFQNQANYHQITFFDCGLGDLSLIETAGGSAILIDTGPTERTSQHFDRSALPYLRKNGIKELDMLFLTHAHNDHYGGLESVLANMEVKQLAVTDEFISHKVWLRYQEDIDLEDCEIITIIDTITFFIDDVRLKIIHPDREFSDNNINNNSIVIAAEFTDFNILFTGDLEEEGEHYLLQRYPQYLKSEFLKVGHHGSKTASSTAFISVVQPDFAFISTSLQNRFDFPHPETMITLSFLEDQLFIAGADGAVQVLIAENEKIVKTIKSNKIFQID